MLLNLIDGLRVAFHDNGRLFASSWHERLSSRRYCGRPPHRRACSRRAHFRGNIERRANRRQGAGQNPCMPCMVGFQSDCGGIGVFIGTRIVHAL